MPTIAYDASRAALYTPELRETLFVAGREYSMLQLAVEAARLAYYRAEANAAERRRLAEALARAGFGAPQPFADAASGTQAFAALRAADGLALVAFRGTQPDEKVDLATDLAALSVPWPEARGLVHAGFAQAARALLPAIGAWLAHGEGQHRRALLVAGHSLGAALATLAASVWRPALWVALGSPRVGDAAFAAALAGIAGKRIVDCCDAVTELPPAGPLFTHVGPASYLTRDAQLVENPDAAFVAADRLQARADYAAQHAGRPGAVLLRDLADHAPVNYARAFF